MAYDHSDIRRWVVDRSEEILDEAFMPMRSLAANEDEAHAQHELIEHYVQEFATYLFEAGLDARTAPEEVFDAVREVVSKVMTNR